MGGWKKSLSKLCTTVIEVYNLAKITIAFLMVLFVIYCLPQTTSKLSNALLYFTDLFCCWLPYPQLVCSATFERTSLLSYPNFTLQGLDFFTKQIGGSLKTGVGAHWFCLWNHRKLEKVATHLIFSAFYINLVSFLMVSQLLAVISNIFIS